MGHETAGRLAAHPGSLSSLRNDLRRSLPIWLALMAFFFAMFAALRLTHTSLLEALEYDETNPGALAEALKIERDMHFAKFMDARQGVNASGEAWKSEADQARRLYEKAFRAYPESPGVCARLSILAEAEGNKDRWAYYAGLAAMQDQRPDQARENFAQAIEFNPDFVPAREALAQMLLSDNDTTGAREQVAAALKSQPNSPRSLFLLGEVESWEGNVEAMRKDWEKALDIDPEDSEIRIRLAMYLIEHKESDKGLSLLSEGEELAPKDAHMAHVAGLGYFRVEQYEEALSYFKKAYRLSPSSASVMADLARVYARLGKQRLAASYLQRAVALDPTYQNEVLFPEKNP